MRSRFASLSLALAAAAGVLAVAPTPAGATGFLVARFGGEHGHPTTDNPTAIYYNPAGLSLLGGTRLYLDGTFAWRSFGYDRPEGAIDNVLAAPSSGTGTPAGGGVAANTGESSLFNVLGTPFIGLATDFGVPNLGVGVAFYVPFGGSTVFDDAVASDTYPGAVDGPSRWWVIEGTIRSMYLSAAVSYRFPEIGLSVGAGFNLVFSQMDTIRARNTDGTDNLVSSGNLQEGRAYMDVSGIDVALSVGLIWQATEHLFLGVSYQSQPAFGDMNLNSGDLTLILGSGPVDDVKPVPAEFHQELPDIVRVGARYTVPRDWELRLFGEWDHWSVLESQCILDRTIVGRKCSLTEPVGKILIIPRKWNDGFGLRAGGSWWASDTVELYLGGGYDSNVVPDGFIDPSLYDSVKGSVAAGARFSLFDDTLLLSVSYTQIIYADRDVAPRGRVPLDPSKPDGATISDISNLGISEAVRQPDAAGSYTQAIGVLDVSAEYRF
jgi:long-chain fatty acid transport protein